MIFEKKPFKTNVFSTFLLLDIENSQKTSGFIRCCEITIFLIFRKVYKKQGISTLLKHSISTKIEHTYKTNVFSIIFVITLTLFLLLLSVSRGGYAYAVRYHSAIYFHTYSIQPCSTQYAYAVRYYLAIYLLIKFSHLFPYFLLLIPLF